MSNYKVFKKVHDPVKSNFMTLCQENKRFSDLDSSVLPHFMVCASLLKRLRVILPDLASKFPTIKLWPCGTRFFTKITVFKHPRNIETYVEIYRSIFHDSFLFELLYTLGSVIFFANE